MRKTRIAALIAWLFPSIGAGSQVSLAFNGGIPDQQSLVNALNSINPLAQTNFNSASNTAAFTAIGSQVAGGQVNVLALTGALGAGAALTLPTVAAMIAALPANMQANPVGVSFELRVINVSATQTWTMTTNTGWTLTGTMTVATATFRDFIVTITAGGATPTAVMQNVGSGTP